MPISADDLAILEADAAGKPVRRRAERLPDVDGDANASRAVDTYVVFVANLHDDLTLLDARVWFTGTSRTCDVAIALDDQAPTPLGRAKASRPDVTVGWFTPAAKIDGLRLGDIPARHCRAVWIRRTATDSPPVDDDGIALAVEGDSRHG